MNTRLTVIRQHRAALRAKAGSQREELARLVEPWRKPLTLVDGGIALLRRARANPLAIAIGAVLLVRMGMGRRHWTTWVGRLWTGWHLYQSLFDWRSKGHS
jgi:hypothetical protein